MNALKQLITNEKISSQKACSVLGVKQSTFSHRLNRDMKGTIEWSMELAKEMNINSYSFIKDGCTVHVKLK